MIPVKLRMRNFMCYREDVPPLYFDGIHTACICGDNGNGKSALIDAVTWALWGRTRARSDDDLVYSGEREMEVEFDFAADGQVYRVIRKHARPKRRQAAGQSSLDLLIASGDSFKVISGDRIKQTQQKIIAILHLDYETFINSALLRQGDADQFTKQTPVKRKEVLANILGLAFYDELEQEAKELARELETEKAEIESVIQDIGVELTRKPEYQAELERAQAELLRTRDLVKEQESNLSKLRQERESLESKRQQLDQLKEQMARTTRDLERWGEQTRQRRSQLDEYDEVMSQRARIDEDYARLVEVRKECDDLDRKLRTVAVLNDRKHRLEMAVFQAKEGLVKEHALAQSRIKDLEYKSQRLGQLRNELYQVQNEIGRLSQEEESLRSRKDEAHQLRAAISYSESNIAQQEREITEIEEKLKLLTQGEARCPLCETELGTEGLRLIENKYQMERQSKYQTGQSSQAELAARKAELASLESKVSQREADLNKSRAEAQGRASFLGQQVAESEAAGSQLKEVEENLAELEERLVRRDYAISEQQALDELERELAAVDYDSQQHERVRQDLANLEQYETPKRRLEEADRFYGQEKEALEYAEKASQELARSLELDNQRSREMTGELGFLPQLADTLAHAEAEHQALSAQQKQVEEAAWTAKQKLDYCAELEGKKSQKEGLLAEASKEEGVYKELSEAFGKRGIQALLIEMALPEIELEANRLLARMTDNRMHVKIETQRETKKGDLLETLDINISDELGMRNYEMFSGGEAFRINLAIRIALSRLLARRAGAPLPTLIVDEGFGTQDNDGIEKLKEAINSIQDDFDKILIITHIDELKDAFPTRIDVIKTAQGSTLQLS